MSDQQARNCGIQDEDQQRRHAPPVVAAAPQYLARARALAQRLALPLRTTPPVDGVALWAGERLELRQHGPRAPGPVWVEFVDGAPGHRRRTGGGRNQLIARAIGVKRDECPRVIDTTAGLGRDAFVLASLGCRVEMIERSPIIAALLEDGLRRALEVAEAAPIVRRMHLYPGDACVLLPRLAGANTECVVYLDPMFPERGKKALAKKEMQSLKALLGEQEREAPRLLEAALASGARRIVLKRPRRAPRVAGPEPTLCFAGKSTRFDVYLRTPAPPTDRDA